MVMNGFGIKESHAVAMAESATMPYSAFLNMMSSARGDIPGCRWSVAALSVGKYIDVTVSNESFQVEHESYNVVACLTLPFKACAGG